MAYEYSEVRTSQEILAYLQEHMQLGERDSPHLYKAYTESDNIQGLVKSGGDVMGCHIERYESVIYLFPYELSSMMAMSRAQLRAEVCKSDAKESDVNLVLFCIFVLSMEFYDGDGASSKVRDVLRVEEFQNRVSERLREGDERYTRDQQENVGLHFSLMRSAYEGLKSTDWGTTSKTTKEGMLHHLLTFLDRQNLIAYMPKDHMIQTTQRFDHIMDNWVLSQENYRSWVDIVEGNAYV